MEEEQEQERETEEQMDSQSPHEESPWDYSQALTAISTSQLSSQVSIKNISVLVSEYMTLRGLEKVVWQKSPSTPGLYATMNFIKTVESDELNVNLRPVNHVLLFSDGSALLLSEMEADGVLSHLQDTISRMTRIRLTTLSHVEEFGEGAKCSAGNSYLRIDPYVLTAMELFNGKTTFPQDRILHLKHMLADSLAKSAAMELVILRGKGSSLAHSDLERYCTAEV
jgi:hypothetical protein